MEKVTQRMEQPEEPGVPADYFVVGGAAVYEWYVSREMAQGVLASLDLVPAPQWLVFVDLTGACIRVRSRRIDYVYQRSAEQRTMERAFRRARRHEEKSERDWDEE